jgi:hypothetical protein
MTSHEFREWQGYDNDQPFGDYRADARIALLTALIANTNRDRERHPDPYSVADFMPFFGVSDTLQRQPELTEDEERARLTEKVVSLNVLFGGIDRRGTGTEPKPS